MAHKAITGPTFSSHTFEKNIVFMLCILQYLDYVNVMAYDVYWTGYDFSMDIEALLALGIPKERNFLLVTH